MQKNKFYGIQVLATPDGKYHTWTHSGRTGEPGQTSLRGPSTKNEAVSLFEKKFREKTGLRWDKRSDYPKPGKVSDQGGQLFGLYYGLSYG